MPFIKRDGSNNIQGVYACKQSGYGEEYLAADSVEYLQYIGDEQQASDDLDAQRLADRVSLLTWAQIETAINNAFPDSAQANIVRKLARALYTVITNSVN